MPTLLIDGTTSPYVNLAAAMAALSAQAATGCYAEGLASIPSATRDFFDSSFSAGALTVDSHWSISASGTKTDNTLSLVFVTSSGGLHLDWAFDTDGSPVTQTIDIYADDGITLIDSVSGGASSADISIPSDGYYFIFTTFTVTDPSFMDSLVTSSPTTGTDFMPCVVRAAYGGTPDYLVCS